MRFSRYLLSCCALFCATLPVHASNLIVITDQAHPVQNLPAQARLIYLDTAEQYQETLSQNLPDAPEQAAQIARKRLDEGGQAMQQAMRGALQGVVDAWSLGISKIPAVIVDQRYVIYGQTDVGQAVQKINNYKENRP